jgi:hypothetical protein
VKRGVPIYGSHFPGLSFKLQFNSTGLPNIRLYDVRHAMVVQISFEKRAELFLSRCCILIKTINSESGVWLISPLEPALAFVPFHIHAIECRGPDRPWSNS